MEPDHYYLNANAANVWPSNLPSQPVQAVITEQRPGPILPGQGAPKHFSLVRAQVAGTQQLPVFECITQANPGGVYDPNASIYDVTITQTYTSFPATIKSTTYEQAGSTGYISLADSSSRTMTVVNAQLPFATGPTPGAPTNTYGNALEYMSNTINDLNADALKVDAATDFKAVFRVYCETYPPTVYTNNGAVDPGVAYRGFVERSCSKRFFLNGPQMTAAAWKGYLACLGIWVPDCSSRSISAQLNPLTNKYEITGTQGVYLADLYGPNGFGPQSTQTSTRNVVWAPADSTAPAPLAFTTPSYYHFAYSVAHVVELVNAAFRAATYDVWSAQRPAMGYEDAPAESPTLTYDDASGKFSLLLPTSMYLPAPPSYYPDPTNGGPPFSQRLVSTLSFNEHLWLLFSTFPFVYPTSSSYQVSIPVTAPIVTYNGISCFQVTQEEISTSQNWTPVDSLAFLSATIPVAYEDQSALGQVFSQGGFVPANYSPVITDIVLPLARCTDWRTLITYSPSLYRMTDLSPAHNQSKLDVIIMWRHKYSGKLLPLLVQPNSSVGVKIGLFTPGVSS